MAVAPHPSLGAQAWWQRLQERAQAPGQHLQGIRHACLSARQGHPEWHGSYSEARLYCRGLHLDLTAELLRSQWQVQLRGHWWRSRDAPAAGVGLGLGGAGGRGGLVPAGVAGGGRGGVWLASPPGPLCWSPINTKRPGLGVWNLKAHLGPPDRGPRGAGARGAGRAADQPSCCPDDPVKTRQPVAATMASDCARLGPSKPGLPLPRSSMPTPLLSRGSGLQAAALHSLQNDCLQNGRSNAALVTRWCCKATSRRTPPNAAQLLLRLLLLLLRAARLVLCAVGWAGRIRNRQLELFISGHTACSNRPSNARQQPTSPAAQPCVSAAPQVTTPG